MATLTNYAAVQAALNNFVTQAGVSPGLAPHHTFWNTMSYQQFITGGVPGGPWKILEVGSSKNSTIIQILSGYGKAYDNFGQMPRPSPPYEPEQGTLITELAAWIDGGCQNNS
jgi:hypothetical protein